MDLQPGDRLTLRDALYSTLLGSDNVSALTVASFVGRDLVSRRGGGAPIAAFVAEMNKFGPFPEDGQNALYRSHGWTPATPFPLPARWIWPCWAFTACKIRLFATLFPRRAGALSAVPDQGQDDV